MANINEKRWETVKQRQAADFIYAVKSTGIYCRPGCSSKLPLRGNVVFFTNGEDALRAGFRACKRCRPDKSESDSWFISACRTLETEEPAPSLNELAAAANMGARHFHRMFSQRAGITPKQYALQVRRQKWRACLKNGGRIIDAVFDSGFNSGARAYEKVGEDLGMTPGAYRRGAPGEQIQCAVTNCALGKMLVAATKRGVCAIHLGDCEKTLRAMVQKQFPRAVWTEGDKTFLTWVRKAAALTRAPHMESDLPLDIRGTVFQQKVWRALQTLPPGKPSSYSDLAKSVGSPTAVRAVASACARNPVAVIVPCHRVVGKNGALCGYRWGVNRKRELLTKEKAAVKA